MSMSVSPIVEQRRYLSRYSCQHLPKSLDSQRKRTILKENVQTLLDKKIGAENDQAEGQR